MDTYSLSRGFLFCSDWNWSFYLLTPCHFSLKTLYAPSQDRLQNDFGGFGGPKRPLFKPERGGAAFPPPPSSWLPQPRRLAQGVRSCEQLPKILRDRRGKRTRRDDVHIHETEVQEHCRPARGAFTLFYDSFLFFKFFFTICSKMSQSSPCGFQWSPLWLAWLAALVVQLVLSSPYSSPSTYQRPATSGRRPGFMERTLVLLDVNTRSPIRVLNDNFLSLQLDPSIIKDGWLDFLRYFFPCTSEMCPTTFGGC